MFRNYFKTAWRNLIKNRLYSFINLVGLSTGLAASLLIGIYIMNELNYDQFHSNKDRIVRTIMQYSQAGNVNTGATTGTKVGPQFKRTFPSVEEYVRTFLSHNTVKRGDKIFEETGILFADEPFFKVFSFPLLEGDTATALNGPDKLVLTKSTARKYFGNEEAVGKTLTTMGKEFTVSAVCEDVPQNSQIKFDFVTRFSNLGYVKEEIWWSANWVTYFLLRDAKDIDPFQKQITEYMKTPAVRTDAGLEGNNSLTYFIEPLTSVHLHSPHAGFEPNGSFTYIGIFGAIALLILLIACANYTNLATAQSAKRAAEIGMRKVLGASKRLVFFQFLSESTFITFVAAIIAFGLAAVLIPAFNSITGKHFSVQMLLSFQPVFLLVISSLVVSFLAGIYPALVLSGGQTIGILKKGFSFTGDKSLMRKTLIVAQFGIAIFLIISTLTMLQQMHFMQTKNLGYNKDHVIILPVYGSMMQDFDNLKAAFTRVNGVEGVTASYDTPEYVQWGDGIQAIDENGKREISLTAMPVDLDFVKTLKMELVSGRDFQPGDFAMMDTTNKSANYHIPFIINETLAKQIGWKPEEALNKTLEKGVSGPVVGVVKDFHFNSLHESIGPMLIFLGRDYSRNLMIRIHGEDVNGSLARLETVWKQRVPDRPFSYHFLDEDYNKLYKAEQQTAALFSVASSLAILLACLGLFGLVAFTIVQRTKEIGIRKVLGASVGVIINLLSKDFLKLIGVAIVIAAPFAWLMADRWLKDFAYRIDVNWVLFAEAGCIALAIAAVTIGFHAVKVAIANPVKSLRTE